MTSLVDDFETTLIEFPDGPQYLVHVPNKLDEYAIQFHRATGTILHGGKITSTPDPTTGYETFTLGERNLGVCPDRATFSMVLATHSDTPAEVDHTDENSEQFLRYLEACKEHKVTETPQSTAEKKAGKFKNRMLTLKCRIANGVALHELPLGPWSADADVIRGRDGKVEYTRVKKVAEPAEQAAGSGGGLLGFFRRTKDS